MPANQTVEGGEFMSILTDVSKTSYGLHFS